MNTYQETVGEASTWSRGPDIRSASWLGIAGGNRFKGNTRAVGDPGYLIAMPKPTRLALHMALHEEQERRALEGELRLLETAWTQHRGERGAT